MPGLTGHKAPIKLTPNEGEKRKKEASTTEVRLQTICVKCLNYIPQELNSGISIEYMKNPLHHTLVVYRGAVGAD